MAQGRVLAAALLLMITCVQGRWVVFEEDATVQQPEASSESTTYTLVQAGQNNEFEQPVAILDAWGSLDTTVNGFWGNLLSPRSDRSASNANPISWMYQQLEAVEMLQLSALNGLLFGTGHPDEQDGQLDDAASSTQQMLQHVGCSRFRPAMQDYGRQHDRYGYLGDSGSLLNDLLASSHSASSSKDADTSTTTVFISDSYDYAADDIATADEQPLTSLSSTMRHQQDMQDHSEQQQQGEDESIFMDAQDVQRLFSSVSEAFAPHANSDLSTEKDTAVDSALRRAHGSLSELLQSVAKRRDDEQLEPQQNSHSGEEMSARAAAAAQYSYLGKDAAGVLGEYFGDDVDEDALAYEEGGVEEELYEAEASGYEQDDAGYGSSDADATGIMAAGTQHPDQVAVDSFLLSQVLGADDSRSVHESPQYKRRHSAGNAAELDKSTSVTWSADGGLVLETYQPHSGRQRSSNKQTPHTDAPAQANRHPTLVVDDDLVWSWTDETGSLNWGLVILTLLVTASIVVLVGAVHSYGQLRCAVSTVNGVPLVCHGGVLFAQQHMYRCNSDTSHLCEPLLDVEGQQLAGDNLAGAHAPQGSHSLEYAALHAQAQHHTK